jgi:hypothetical protein
MKIISASALARAGRHCFKSRFHSQLSFSIITVCLYGGVVFWLSWSPPELLSTASILTEQIRLDVIDGAKTAFPIFGMKLSSPGSPSDGKCAEGLLTPSSQSTVIYGRAGSGPLEIELRRTTPPAAGGSPIVGRLEPSSGAPVQLIAPVYLEADPATCLTGAPTELPVWGQLSVGQEFRPIAHSGPRDPTMLLSGALRVMARTALFSPRLYHIEDMVLPVGSRLEAKHEAGRNESWNWWGAAYIDPNRPALVLEVATDARSLVVYRPNRSDADVIEVSALEQLFSDPNIVWLQIVVGSIVVLVQFAGFLASFQHRAETDGQKARSTPHRIAPNAALLLCLLLPAVGQADHVRLRTSENSWGQGWMFLDTDGVCKVVTAGHVVRSVDGHVVHPLVVDGHAREMTTGAPLLLSADPDIAVLPIPAANGATACGSGRLSAIGVERRVTDMTDSAILTTGKSELQQIAVERRASSLDSGGGKFFAVRPLAAGDRVTEGWSGSAVIDHDGPLGIVFAVDGEHNEAIATRVDVVRKLMAAAVVNPAGDAANVSVPRAITVLSGATIDPARGPDQLERGGGGWLVRPSHHKIEFTAVFTEARQIKLVMLGAEANPANSIKGFAIATQASAVGDDWVNVAYCEHAAGTDAADACRFSARTVLQVRIAAKTANDEPLVIKTFASQ